MKNKFPLILVLIFCCTLFGYQYYNNNLDKILCSKAENYYHKNNIVKAQEYYEKAFELGCNNHKKRSQYVNSIINSPTNADSQEKLLKFLENPVEDVANLDAKYYINDLKQKINKKYLGNYISNAVYNQSIMRWGNLPISYGFKNTTNVPEYFIEEIRNAFSEWQDATDNEIQFVEKENNSNIIIKLSKHNPADDNDLKYVVAYTIPKTELNTLKNMEIKFYLKDIEGKYFSKNQVYNTALHEIAHALGFMGHCDDINNVMYLTKDAKSVINDSRKILTEADINTMKLLYKIKPQITNIKNPSGEYCLNVALGTNEEINNEKEEEAIAYINNAPELPNGYIDLAEILLLEKQYKKAIKNLNKALKFSETKELKSLVYYNLAVAHYHNKDFSTAKDYLLKSITINSTDEKRYFLAEILVKEGNITNGIKELESLSEQNPKNIEYTIFLTNLYIQKKDLLQARKTLKQFLKNNPHEKNNPRLFSYGILKFGL